MPFATIAMGILVLFVGGSFHRKLNRIIRMYQNIDQAIAGLTDQVANLTTVDQSAEALLSGLSLQLTKALDQLKQQGVTAAQLASLQSLADAMGTQASGLAAAVTANTEQPAPPEQPPAPPVGDDTVTASTGDDTISGTSGSTLDAGAGADTVDAGAGGDTTSA